MDCRLAARRVHRHQDGEDGEDGRGREGAWRASRGDRDVSRRVCSVSAVLFSGNSTRAVATRRPVATAIGVPGRPSRHFQPLRLFARGRLLPYPHPFSCSIDNLNEHEIMVYPYVPYSCSAVASTFCALRWYYTAKPRANGKRSKDGGTDHLADGARCHLALGHTVRA